MPNHYTRTIPELTDSERADLQRWVRRRNLSQSLALRAKIILASAEGHSDQIVAEQLDISRATVGKWRRRFLDNGCDELIDLPRSGNPEPYPMTS